MPVNNRHAITLRVMRRKLASPLPQRNGVDATRVALPAQGPWATVLEYLVDRFPQAAEGQFEAMLREGKIVGRNGPLGRDAAFVGQSFVWFHRELPQETPVPYDLTIVYRDDELLVVDKPHFLATTPRGGHVAETALVRLRRDLDLPQLSPAHRLDRATAGLVMFVIKPERRREYQMLFQNRLVRKEYQAVARYRPGMEFPRTIRSHIVKRRGYLAAEEIPGAANSETQIDLLERRGDHARYRLCPATGRTHQLRVHMNSLGLPIFGDDLYPEIAPAASDDFSDPLQLLATRLEFQDPISGQYRCFITGLGLAAWHERN